MRDYTHIRVTTDTHEKLRDFKHELIVQERDYMNHSFDDLINILLDERDE